MIQLISPSHAVTLMNTLGAKRKPFLFAFDFELKHSFVIENPINRQEVLFCLPKYTNDTCHITRQIPKIYSFPIEYGIYKQGFDVIQNALYRGDSYLANYTVSTPIEITHSLKEIFHLVKSPFKLYLPDSFVCFSPERFVKIENNKIFTYPMKGTIDATIPNADKIIINDKKETAEHVTVVDLLRNDIGMVSQQVNVSRFRYLDRIKTSYGNILQVSSEIVGLIHKNWQSVVGEIILKLLPAGSICGAPKEATLKAIDQAEMSPRGFYTGVFGYFDGESLDSAVLIRFIEKRKNKYFFRSGGGITVNSTCEKEYQEVNQKIYLPL